MLGGYFTLHSIHPAQGIKMFFLLTCVCLLWMLFQGVHLHPYNSLVNFVLTRTNNFRSLELQDESFSMMRVVSSDVEENSVCLKEHVLDYRLNCSGLYQYIDKCFSGPQFGQRPLPNYFIDRVFENESLLAEYRSAHVAFIHVEKSGGTSIESILEKIKINDGESVSELRCGLCWHVAVIMNHVIKFDNRYVIMAHRTYGMHHYLRNNFKFMYLFMMRDPVNRCVSNYYYIRDVVNRRYQYLIKKYLYNSHDLTDFLQLTENVHIPIFNNMYTRSLVFDGHPDIYTNYVDCCGALSAPAEAPVITEEHYLIAKKNLQESVAFVGILEDHKSSQDMLLEMLDFPPAKGEIHERANEHRIALSSYEISELTKRNEWDIKLYQDALEIFRNQQKAYKQSRTMRT